MRWQFWQKEAPRELTDNVKKTLLNQFPLDAEVADRVRYLGKKGRFSGRPAHFLRIFDPALITEGGVTSFEGLGDNQDHRAALLFEGRIERIYDADQVYLTDRRAA